MIKSVSDNSWTLGSVFPYVFPKRSLILQAETAQISESLTGKVPWNGDGQMDGTRSFCEEDM